MHTEIHKRRIPVAVVILAESAVTGIALMATVLRHLVVVLALLVGQLFLRCNDKVLAPRIPPLGVRIHVVPYGRLLHVRSLINVAGSVMLVLFHAADQRPLVAIVRMSVALPALFLTDQRVFLRIAALVVMMRLHLLLFTDQVPFLITTARIMLMSICLIQPAGEDIRRLVAFVCMLVGTRFLLPADKRVLVARPVVLMLR